ncbi:MAG: ribonuclease [Polaromonas sp.]|nr:ribonuclease [Polaromonas sp.]
MWRNGCKRWLQGSAAVWMSFALCCGTLSPSVVQAKGVVQEPVASVALADLPAQGRDMMVLIYQGGPFRYDRDGTVFGNRERMLPAKNRGYYREYTVRTPSERTRGARRIICGGLKPAAPDACYYTDDHYASFRRIVRPAGQ